MSEINPNNGGSMNEVTIGGRTIDEAMRMIRHRQNLDLGRRQERIDEMTTRLVGLPRQDLVDILRRPDINPRSIVRGQANGIGWASLAREIGYGADLPYMHDLARAVRQALGGAEAVRQMNADIEAERILQTAGQLSTWADKTIESTIEDDGGMGKLAKVLGLELGFRVTIQMLWIASSVTGQNHTIRDANKRQWEAREARRAQLAEAHEAPRPHFNKEEAVA